jgi:hypothetical protein
MPASAFVTLEPHDRWALDVLVGHLRQRRTPIGLVDYIVQNWRDNVWKAESSRRMGRTAGTIVLIGLTTYRSYVVGWEVEQTRRQGHHLLGIQIHADQTHLVPGGLSPENVLPWDVERIHATLVSWT